MRHGLATGGLALSLLIFGAQGLQAQAETEPNDTKATANAFTLPVASTTGVITGTSIGATGVELDYFRVTTAAQAAPGFYRHRLICVSAPVGHTVTIRGFTQTAGVINTGTDIAFQTSSTVTTPARFVQWYTSEAPGQAFVRVTGGAATVNPYSLDYEVTPVTEIAGPGAIAQGSITITTVGQTTVDTDLWIYDGTRTAIVDAGNDDIIDPGAILQSQLIRTYLPGTFYMAITNFQAANNLASPVDDEFRNGTVVDFPGVHANSSTAVNLDLDSVIGGTPVTALKVGPYDVVFVSFGVVIPVELMDFKIE